MKSECDAKGVKLRVNPPNNGMTLRIDEGLIEQIIINTCHNAIDALKATNNPTITLESYSVGYSNAISI